MIRRGYCTISRRRRWPGPTSMVRWPCAGSSGPLEAAPEGPPARPGAGRTPPPWSVAGSAVGFRILLVGDRILPQRPEPVEIRRAGQFVGHAVVQHRQAREEGVAVEARPGPGAAQVG